MTSGYGTYSKTVANLAVANHFFLSSEEEVRAIFLTSI